MNKRDTVKNILWIIVGVAAAVALMRFRHGLGATTALSDATPWGLWIGFDVMGGVALAAGGFVIAAIVHVFHLKKYYPILRSAVLTALIGYGAVIVGLLFDIGLPWNIWHPIIFPQIHSVLFEVAMCVMLYFTVLALEFSPVILEHKWFQYPFFQAIYKLLKWFTIPLVCAGVMLSTLHQSSLGSLFLIMPFRLHPLWWSPIIPVLFFISAIGLGLMMVTLESLVSSWLFNHKPKIDLLAGLGRAASIVLFLYLIIRFVDLGIRGILPHMFDGSTGSILFLSENLWSALIPAVLLAFPRIRRSLAGLTTCSLLVVTGFVLNRLNAAFIVNHQAIGTTYIPSLTEIIVSAGIVAGGILIFIFFVENLKVYPKEQKASFDLHAIPVIEEMTRTWVGERLWKSVRLRSFLFIAAFAVAFSLIPASGIKGFQIAPTPVKPALRGWDVLTINGNRNDKFVQFDHEMHKQNSEEMYGEGTESCRICHHMGKPSEGPTDCSACHSDMYLETSIFDHRFHEKQHEGVEKDLCGICHEKGKAKSGETANSCLVCHSDMFLDTPTTEMPNYQALSYYDAMHGLCLECHTEMKDDADNPDLDLCTTCHKGQ